MRAQFHGIAPELFVAAMREGMEHEKLSILRAENLPHVPPAVRRRGMFNKSGYTRHTSTARKKIPARKVSWAPLALALGFAFLPGCSKKTACLVEQDTATLSCSPDKLFARPKRDKNTLEVTAMAYTAKSVGRGGKTLPRAANGQALTPDVSAIAVSPDLIERHGLSLNQTVRISGLEGEYTVMDLMNPRHEKSIDIYFGNDNHGARQWGRRTLHISWE